MKRSQKELAGRNLITMDNTMGQVKDLLFDEETWIVRYVEADFGSLFASKRILIPRMLLKDSQVNKDHFFIELTKNDIERCPKPEDDMTVSRKYEEELNKYYRIDNYWIHTYSDPGMGVGAGLFNPPSPLRIPGPMVTERDLGISLRSFKEVKGYKILNGFIPVI